MTRIMEINKTIFLICAGVALGFVFFSYPLPPLGEGRLTAFAIDWLTTGLLVFLTGFISLTGNRRVQEAGMFLRSPVSFDGPGAHFATLHAQDVAFAEILPSPQFIDCLGLLALCGSLLLLGPLGCLALIFGGIIRLGGLLSGSHEQVNQA